MPVRSAVAAFDLVPGPDLSSAEDALPNEWSARSTRVAFQIDVPLAAGWYRLRLSVTNFDRFAIRKRAELFADGEPVESFEWNRELREDLLVRLARPVRGLELQLRNVAGRFDLDRFDLRPASPARTAARAVKLKFNLLRSYNCFWPVVSRGGKLLVQGRVGEFGRKLLRGIPDSRSMRIEVKRASEVAAMWWRRRALSTDEIATLKAEADAIVDPRPLAVLIPADPTRCDHARQAILSVLRQVYPHWELAVAWPTATVSEKLLSVAKWDSRIRIVSSETGDWKDAVQCALDTFESDRVVVLPPDWELAEQALLRLSQRDGECAGPAMLDRSRLLAGLPQMEAQSAIGVVRWAASLVPADAATTREPLAFPLDSGRTIEAIRHPSPYANPLVLAADVRGIGGWDHVAFEVLKGLRSTGLELRQHSVAKVFPDLLPPDLRPEPIARRDELQLVIAPPFLVKRFGPDSNTAVYTMWETDRIDPAHAAVLNRARIVIVPSRWGADCFRESGVTVPIEVAPLGYDPLVFHPTREPRDPSICTFGTAGALSAGGLRKNVGRVVELFRKAFPTESDVWLRVKITPNCPPFEIADDPRIEVIRATLPYSDLARWNRSLDAYVNASFAEGFGLHLLEAMACGVPLISTHSSGLTEFFDGRVGHVVPHRLIETRNEYYCGRWADPDDCELIERMRRVYRNRAEAAELGELAAARARRFTWRDGGRQLANILERHGILETKQ